MSICDLETGITSFKGSQKTSGSSICRPPFAKENTWMQHGQASPHLFPHGTALVPHGWLKMSNSAGHPRYDWVLIWTISGKVPRKSSAMKVAHSSSTLGVPMQGLWYKPPSQASPTSAWLLHYSIAFLPVGRINSHSQASNCLHISVSTVRHLLQRYTWRR